MSRYVLVLGASGFIGHRLVSTLALRGHGVTAVTRRPHQFGGTVCSRVCDFSSPEVVLPELEGVDTVVHAATTSTPASSARTPLDELNGNLRTTAALLTALQEAPHVRLLYLSSGGTLYGNSGDIGKTEHEPLRPRSYHGAAKAASELFIGAWAQQYGGSAVIARPSNLYGPGQPAKPSFGIVPAAFHSAQSGDPITIFGDGGSKRDYIFVDDMVAFLLDVLEAPPMPGVRTYNVSSGVTLPVSRVLDEVAAVVGKQILRTYLPRRPSDIETIALDNSSARTEFSWTPRTTIRDGLQATWEWMKHRNAQH